MGLSKNGFIAQICIYLKNGMSKEALDLSKEFAAAFPNEMLAQYLLSQAAYAVGEYQLSAASARKSFNLAKNEEDMWISGLHACLSYYQLEEFRKGLLLLKELEKKVKNSDIERLMFLFSIALDDTAEAEKHLKWLIDNNASEADRFVSTLLSKMKK